MNNSDELIYSGSENIGLPIANPIRNDPPQWEIISGTEYSMVLMSSVTLDGAIFDNTGENCVAAFGPGGDVDCRSIGVWQEPNPPYYDGFWYFTIVGNTIGDTISFKLYDESSDEVYSCNEMVIFDNNATIGIPSEPFLLTCNSTNSIILPQNNQLQCEIYPNPFNPSGAGAGPCPTTTISFSGIENDENINISIFNIKGQKINSKQLEFDSDSLTNNIVWDGTNYNKRPVTSGIYFIKATDGKDTVIKKVMLLK